MVQFVLVVHHCDGSVSLPMGPTEAPMSGYAIPDDLIAAAIADRGKAHPWETIPVARTALIVIDMQNYFVAPDAQGEAETARDIVPAINRLAGELRGRGGRVVWMQNTTTDTREKWS